MRSCINNIVALLHDSAFGIRYENVIMQEGTSKKERNIFT